MNEQRRAGTSGIRGLEALHTVTLNNAEQAMARGDPSDALEWLDRLPTGECPRALVAEAHHQCAKQALAAGSWGVVEQHLAKANQAQPSALLQKRLALVRRRRPMLDDHAWEQMRSTVDAATRLGSGMVAPEVSLVVACGAYYSRGRNSGSPWSRFLRMSKDPPPMGAERDAVIAMSTGYFCRYLAEETDLCGVVDAVVAVPTSPDRYLRRGMSLPEELAAAVQCQLAIPVLPKALSSTADPGLKMRGLSWGDRRSAMRGTMACEPLDPADRRAILVVDDVVTSGATLREAGRALRAAGASDVVAATLSHTEG